MPMPETDGVINGQVMVFAPFICRGVRIMRRVTQLPHFAGLLYGIQIQHSAINIL